MTAIIVEDEYKVYQLINNLVDWVEMGIEIVGYCSDGIRAADDILDKNPDIVITDIKMPGMDGVQLIRTIREAGLNTAFIIISGHRDFEYAHSALKLGITEYLLKPISQQELTQALTRIIAGLKRATKNEQTGTMLHQAKRQLEVSLIDRIIAADPEMSEITDQFIQTHYNITFSPGLFQALDVRLFGIPPAKCDTLLAQIELDVRQVIGPVCHRLISYYGKNAELLLLMNYQEGTSPEKTAIKSLISWLDRANIVGMAFVIGVGCTGTDVSFLHQVIETARTACFCRFTRGCNQVFRYDRYMASTKRYDEIVPVHILRRIENRIECMDCRGAIMAIQELLTAIDSITPPEYVKQLFLYIEKISIGVLRESLPREQYCAARSELEQRLNSSATLREISLALEEWMNDKIRLCSQSKKQTGSRTLRLAKKYIEEHYHENISLNTVADYVHLNASYFSVVFKKEAGCTFSEYLTDYRIEKAKSLLKNSNDSISAICVRVGYADVKYFSRIFEKKVGVKPSAYRQIMG